MISLQGTVKASSVVAHTPLTHTCAPTIEQTAVVLGFHEHDIAPMGRAKLLSPLGKPAAKRAKYFAAVDVRSAPNGLGHI